MFIDLHLKVDNSPASININHIVIVYDDSAVKTFDGNLFMFAESYDEIMLKIKSAEVRL